MADPTELPSVPATAPAAEQTTIFHNGQIITMADAAAPAPGRRPQAVVVAGERVVMVGDLEEARRRYPAGVPHDLGGACLLPGFIDAQSHLSGIGLQATIANLLAAPDGTVATVPDLVAQLSVWAGTGPGGRSQWIVGFGYDDAMLRERRHPTATDLDRVVTAKPAIAIHQSFHLGAVNSAGLWLLGFTHETPDPEGGVIRRLGRPGEAGWVPPYGVPNGVLEEAAFTIAYARAGAGIALEDQAGFFERGRQVANRFGFTTVQDGGVDLPVLDFMRDELSAWDIDTVVYGKAAQLVGLEADEARKRLGAGREYVRGGLRVAGVKMFLDGSPQGRTAWLGQPYLTPPDGRPADYRGYPAIADQEAVNAQVRQAFGNGWQVLAHVNGDAAVDQFIVAVETVCRERGEFDAVGNPSAAAMDRRPVAIHCQTVREHQLARFAQLGIIPSLFSMNTFYWGDWYRDVVLGRPRSDTIAPAAWAVGHGLDYTSHHDAPVVLPNSIAILSSQVTRRTRSGRVVGAEQRVSAYQALKSVTINAARQYHEEGWKGTIEAGKVADLVVLSGCPLDFENPQELGEWSDLRVVATIRRGRLMPFDGWGRVREEGEVVGGGGGEGEDGGSEAMAGLVFVHSC